MKLLFSLLMICSWFFVSLAANHDPCGKYKGKNIYKGKDGGCYYLKGKDHRKIYIDRKYCKC